MGVENSVIYADLKMGKFIFVNSSYKKLGPKYPKYLRDLCKNN
jgi:hypothetical protein